MKTRIDWFASEKNFRQALADFCEGKVWQTRCSVELQEKLEEIAEKRHANECLKGSLGYSENYYKLAAQLDEQEQEAREAVNQLRADNPKPFEYSAADQTFWKAWSGSDFEDIAKQKKAIRAWLYAGGIVVTEDNPLVGYLWLGCQRGGKADFSGRNLVKSGGHSLTKWTRGKKSVVEFLYAAVAEEMIAANALRVPYIPASIKERIAAQDKAREARKAASKKAKASK